jgi:hypothetical protein
MTAHILCSLAGSTIQRMLAAYGFVCILCLTPACRHRPPTNPAPTTAPTPADLASMEPDQANTAGWDGAWTNLVNDAEQSFTPSFPRLVGVEVELLVGNAGATEDDLTLTILDAIGQTVAVETKTVQTSNSDHVLFVIPSSGVEVSPGQIYRVKLTGGITFGWKYVVGGYKNGEATFNGNPLLPGARSTFLFRTFGAK